MSKDTVAKKFNGKASGLSWTEFEDGIMSWGRPKYGDKYARGLWEDTLLKIEDLDMENDVDVYDFTNLCEMVFDVLRRESLKTAESLYSSDRFWTKKFQLEERQAQREKLYTYLETILDSEPFRQLKVQGVVKMNSFREHLYVRFGGGEPEVLNERVRLYLLGMPKREGYPSFPHDVNMEDKLNQLEEERDYFFKACPKEKRDTFDPASETRLTRVVLEHVPPNYDEAVERVKTMIKFRKMHAGDVEASFTHLQSQINQNFDSDWLPQYVELRSELVSHYNKLKKRKGFKSGGSTPGKGGQGHPAMFMGSGNRQPGPNNIVCYGCGVPGHRRGAPECKAGPNDVHHSAPEMFKKKQSGKGGKSGNGGAKGICYAWSTGNGYCKYGDNCKFEHSGPKGGRGGGGKGSGGRGGRSRGGSFGRGKGHGGKGGKGKSKGGKGKSPSVRQLSTMVIKDLTRKLEKAGKRDRDTDEEPPASGTRRRAPRHDEDELYNLLRGNPASTLVIETTKDAGYKVDHAGVKRASEERSRAQAISREQDPLLKKVKLDLKKAQDARTARAVKFHGLKGKKLNITDLLGAEKHIGSELPPGSSCITNVDSLEPAANTSGGNRVEVSSPPCPEQSSSKFASGGSREQSKPPVREDLSSKYQFESGGSRVQSKPPVREDQPSKYQSPLKPLNPGVDLKAVHVGLPSSGAADKVDGPLSPPIGPAGTSEDGRRRNLSFLHGGVPFFGEGDKGTTEFAPGNWNKGSRSPPEVKPVIFKGLVLDKTLLPDNTQHPMNCQEFHVWVELYKGNDGDDWFTRRTKHLSYWPGNDAPKTLEDDGIGPITESGRGGVQFMEEYDFCHQTVGSKRTYATFSTTNHGDLQLNTNDSGSRQLGMHDHVLFQDTEFRWREGFITHVYVSMAKEFFYKIMCTKEEIEREQKFGDYSTGEEDPRFAVGQLSTPYWRTQEGVQLFLTNFDLEYPPSEMLHDLTSLQKYSHFDNMTKTERGRALAWSMPVRDSFTKQNGKIRDPDVRHRNQVEDVIIYIRSLTARVRLLSPNDITWIESLTSESLDQLRINLEHDASFVSLLMPEIRADPFWFPADRDAGEEWCLSKKHKGLTKCGRMLTTEYGRTPFDRWGRGQGERYAGEYEDYLWNTVITEHTKVNPGKYLPRVVAKDLINKSDDLFDWTFRPSSSSAPKRNEKDKPPHKVKEERIPESESRSQKEERTSESGSRSLNSESRSFNSLSSRERTRAVYEVEKALRGAITHHDKAVAKNAKDEVDRVEASVIEVPATEEEKRAHNKFCAHFLPSQPPYFDGVAETECTCVRGHSWLVTNVARPTEVAKRGQIHDPGGRICSTCELKILNPPQAAFEEVDPETYYVPKSSKGVSEELKLSEKGKDAGVTLMMIRAIDNSDSDSDECPDLCNDSDSSDSDEDASDTEQGDDDDLPELVQEQPLLVPRQMAPFRDNEPGAHAVHPADPQRSRVYTTNPLSGDYSLNGPMTSGEFAETDWRNARQQSPRSNGWSQPVTRATHDTACEGEPWGIETSSSSTNLDQQNSAAEDVQPLELLQHVTMDDDSQESSSAPVCELERLEEKCKRVLENDIRFKNSSLNKRKSILRSYYEELKQIRSLITSNSPGGYNAPEVYDRMVGRLINRVLDIEEDQGVSHPISSSEPYKVTAKRVREIVSEVDELFKEQAMKVAPDYRPVGPLVSSTADFPTQQELWDMQTGRVRRLLESCDSILEGNARKKPKTQQEHIQELLEKCDEALARKEPENQQEYVQSLLDRCDETLAMADPDENEDVKTCLMQMLV